MIERPDYIPQDYNRIKIVESREDLFKERFDAETDLILYPRSILSAEFGELVKANAFETVAAYAFNCAVNSGKNPVGGLTVGAVASLKESIPATDQRALQALSLIVDDMDAFQENAMTSQFPSLRIIGEHGWQDRRTDEYHVDNVYYLGRAMCVYTPFVTDMLRREDARQVSLQKYEAIGAPVSFSPGVGDVWRHSEKQVHRARPSASPGIPSIRNII